MNGLPYYKRYPRDFIEGTIGLPFELKVTYSFLLDLIYMQGGNLPDDARYISGLLGVSVRKWKSLRDGLIEAGKIQVNGDHLTNYRAVSELESLAKLSRKQAENASGSRKNNNLRKPRQSHTEPEPDKKTASSTPISPKGPTRRDECIQALSQALPNDVASAMFDHREAMPKKDRLTVKAAELMAGKLAQMAADGLDPVEAANNTIMNGWKGVFPPDKPRPPSPANGVDGHDRFAAALRDAERSRDRRAGGPGMDHGAGRKPPGALGALPAEGRAGDDLSHEDGGLARRAGRSSAGGRGDGVREVDPGSEVDAFAEGNPGSGQVLPLLASAGAKW